MAQTLDQIIKEAIEELETWLKENGPEGDISDTVHEIADSSVPVYTGDILTLAAQNHDLAYDVPELGPAFDGEATPINIIAANIYERVYNALMDFASDYEPEEDEE